MLVKSLKSSAMVIIISTMSVCSFASKCSSKVTMNFYAEKLIKNKNSEVTVNINASAPADKADASSKTFLTKLKQISPQATWTVSSLNSSESDSGLMKISAQAIARIDNDKLGELRSKIKNLNVPGEQYKINNINNNAELTTINANKSSLRGDLYKQIIAGEKDLNAVMLDGHTNYKIYKIFFKDSNKAKPVRFMVANKTSHANNETSEKMYMSAQATYAICNFVNSK